MSCAPPPERRGVARQLFLDDEASAVLELRGLNGFERKLGARATATGPCVRVVKRDHRL